MRSYAGRWDWMQYIKFSIKIQFEDPDQDQIYSQMFRSSFQQQQSKNAFTESYMDTN